MLVQAKELLQKYYGYPTFKAGQAKVIASILAGRDTLAIMPTGAGKSICFQIPALIFPGVTLVISPLISLMKDQVDAVNNLGISAAFINSSLSNSEVEQRIAKARGGGYKLLYVAPERLESDRFCALVQSLQIGMVAIDEAHCISQWGHDFRPSYRAVAPFIAKLEQRPVIGAFTATATEEIQRDIANLLALHGPNIYVTGFDRENLSFTVLRGENKKDFVMDYVARHKDQSGIIYAATRKEVDNLHHLLQAKGYACGKYHAGLSENDRTNSQEAFLRDDLPVIVATNAFGMGIDKSNVRYVIHYHMPKNMEAYYQEAGRAGRDGEPGECILLFSAQDVLLQKFLIEQTIFAPERKANEYDKLQTMVDYCHTSRCLRQYILEYFDEENVPSACGNCGNCNDDRELVDITIEAQKIFSCILRMRERYGAALIAAVLKGSKNKKIVELHLDNLTTYGLLKEYALLEIRDMINLLIAEEYLYLVGDEYPVVRLALKAQSVLKGQATVSQKQAKKSKHKEPTPDLSLFEILRKLRKEIADREHVPPYVVFADATLREMSENRPTEEQAMRRVKGVGEMKMAKYGAQFMGAIHQYIVDNGGYPADLETPVLQSVSHKEPDSKVAVSDDIPSHVVTLNMYLEGKSLDTIAAERNLKVMTLQNHIVRCSREGYTVPWDSFIPPQYEEQILQAITTVGGNKLRPIKDILPEEVDYMSITAVLCKYHEMG